MKKSNSQTKPSKQGSFKKFGMYIVLLLLLVLTVAIVKISRDVSNLKANTNSEASGIRNFPRNPVLPINPPGTDNPPGAMITRSPNMYKCGDDCTMETTNMCPSGTSCTYLGLTAFKCVYPDKTCNDNKVNVGGEVKATVKTMKCGEVCGNSAGFGNPNSVCESGTSCMTSPGAGGYLAPKRCYSGVWGTCLRGGTGNGGGIEVPGTGQR